MMKLFLGGYLYIYTPNQQTDLELELSAPAQLTKILDQLGIPQHEVQIVLINDHFSVVENAIIMQNDHVKIFSQINGG